MCVVRTFCIESYQGKELAAFSLWCILPEVRGNPYLAAISDFIPRNPAARPVHSI